MVTPKWVTPALSNRSQSSLPCRRNAQSWDNFTEPFDCNFPHNLSAQSEWQLPQCNRLPPQLLRTRKSRLQLNIIQTNHATCSVHSTAVWVRPAFFPVSVLVRSLHWLALPVTASPRQSTGPVAPLPFKERSFVSWMYVDFFSHALLLVNAEDYKCLISFSSTNHHHHRSGKAIKIDNSVWLRTVLFRCSRIRTRSIDRSYTDSLSSRLGAQF